MLSGLKLKLRSDDPFWLPVSGSGSSYWNPLLVPVTGRQNGSSDMRLELELEEKMVAGES